LTSSHLRLEYADKITFPAVQVAKSSKSKPFPHTGGRAGQGVIKSQGDLLN